MIRWSRIAAGVVLAATVIGAVLLFRLPTAADCRNTSRMVDPTYRHCVSFDGSYVQLREHAMGHTIEGVVFVVAIAIAVLLLRAGIRAMRGRSQKEGKT